MPNDNTPRFCIIDPMGGPVIVKLYVGNSVVAGGDFLLRNVLGKQDVDNFKLTAENLSISTYRLPFQPKDMNQFKLGWHILVCTLDARIENGRVDIQIQQRNAACKLSAPAKYDLTALPPCKLNATTHIDGSMTFVVRTDFK